MSTIVFETTDPITDTTYVIVETSSCTYTHVWNNGVLVSRDVWETTDEARRNFRVQYDLDVPEDK